MSSEYKSGESGPRRTSPNVESSDAANEAAYVLATSIGLSVSERPSKSNRTLDETPQKKTRSPIMKMLNRKESEDGDIVSEHQLEGSPVTNFQPLPKDEENPETYYNMASDSVSVASGPSVASNKSLKMSRSEIRMAAARVNYSAEVSTLKNCPSIDEGEDSVNVFDAHGQLAPYYDGPYVVRRREDGIRVRTRWYGRMEDGYIAWMSINLFDKFGITVYQPPNPKEMKSGIVPPWMYKFSSLPNLAIPMSYFCIGVALQLLRTPLIVYFIEDQNATAAEVNVLFTVMAVPWCFKMIYGFLSDCVPISGLRRKPYFMSGWVIYVISNLLLAVTPMPSIPMCILLVFIQTAGYMLADVMTDALIVERSRYESEAERGTMQSKGYILRFFGSTIGAAIGAVVYNKNVWDWYLPINVVFFINAAIPMFFLVPIVPFMMEIETDCEAQNFFEQCRLLFKTVTLRSVWMPMTFVYIYNALQLTNAAWMNFLVEGINFSAWEIGLVSVCGSVMAWVGIITYKRFFFASNWRVVYFWCTTLASAIAIGQLILVFGVNRKFEISDIFFSAGDDILVEFVIAVQFLPMCIMYLGLCPEGSEGTTYAMLTTWSNLAGSLAFDISTGLTEIWDVSSETIKSGDFSGVWKLSLLCGVIGPIPLIFLFLIPKSKEDQRKLQEDKSTSVIAGIIFIAVMIFTYIITFAESVYEVYYNDESDNYENQRKLLKVAGQWFTNGSRVLSGWNSPR